MSHPADAVAPKAKGGLFEDLIEVLYKPADVFDRARNNGFGKYLLVTALLVAVVIFGTKGLLQPAIDAQFEMQMRMMAERGQAMPEQAQAAGRGFATWSTLGVFVLAALIGPLLNGVFLLIGGKIAGAALSFRQATLIAVLGGMPRILSVLLMPVVALFTETPRSLMDLGLSAARFVDPTSTNPAILGLLANIDVFRIWQILLIGIGVAVIGKVERSAGFIAALVAIGIGIILGLIPAAFFG